MDVDESLMKRAIDLAAQGSGWTNPNPLVGAVVVKGGRVIGEGFHERYGQAHAERNALCDCARRGNDPQGATMYVTLEPCCHQGKQPPCTDALIAAGIKHVVVGSRDPNPLVAGGGFARLREAGISVTRDVLRAECDKLNPFFFHYILTGRPYVVAKWAMTADGKIATHTGDSRWISNESSRADAHDLRHRLAAVMVGVGTVIADDPLLTARRDKESNQPLRVVIDGRLRIPEACRLVQTANKDSLLVATATGGEDRRALRLCGLGVDVLAMPNPEGKVDLSGLMDALGRRGIDSVLVEGGGGLHEAMFCAGLVNEAIIYIAPKVVGGADAKTPVEGRGVDSMADALRLGAPTVERVGDDLKLTYVLAAGGDSQCSPES